MGKVVARMETNSYSAGEENPRMTRIDVARPRPTTKTKCKEHVATDAQSDGPSDASLRSADNQNHAQRSAADLISNSQKTTTERRERARSAPAEAGRML